jgi:flavin reductase (DIM6/NTAB) family NADH-FMN oxidoreductase RutF
VTRRGAGKRSGTADGGSSNLGSDYERVDLNGMTFDERYRLLNGSVIPRPIAFVSTLNANGAVNAAPFSSFMIASVEAGYLAFSVGPSDEPKTTLVNIVREREYVINTVPEELARQVQLCGERQESSAAKLALAGLDLVDATVIRTPRIAQSKIQFECKLHIIIPFAESHLVVGQIVAMHTQAGLVRNGKIDPLVYAPLGRIAGRNYCAVTNIISV